jgi:threonine/homoserine/homoserine lactone efflux protein
VATVLAITFGFLFGFLGSLPVAGPIAALVLARALEGRPRAGIALAAGAALAESAYAALTFWGVAALVGRYPAVLPACRGVAAAILLVLGVLLLRARPLLPGAPAPRDRARGSFLLGLGITALNPTLLVTWTAATATLAASGWLRLTPALVAPFAVAVAIGIVAWFLVMIALVRRYRGQVAPGALRRVLQGTGLALLALAAWLAAGAVRFALA